MSYKPKYCCQCGEKVERSDWQPWTNRRFCQLCETDFGIYDWIPTVIITIGLFLTVIAFGNLWRTPEKKFEISSNAEIQNKNAASPFNRTQNLNTAIVQSKVVQQNESISTVQLKPSVAVNKQNEIDKQSAKQSNSSNTSEVIYFCGAQTKKGNPCTRRVKTNGRCWQHTGQPAILPAEKLIVGK